MKNNRSANALSRRAVGRAAAAAVLSAAALTGGIAPTAQAAPASAPTTGTAPAAIDPAARLAGLRAVVDNGTATWSTARIVEDGRTVWKGAAGVSNRRNGAPVDPNGRFRIGSVTKMFTATVVLQLVGEGRLGLDDPVASHLPGVVPGGDHITVRQLLNHTSGLYNYTDLPAFNPPVAEWVSTGRWRTHTAAGIVADAVKHPPYFAPGRGWMYSNTNYLLAGMVIEKVTGRTWNSEVERRIAGPLGLRNTFMPRTSPFLGGVHARNYTKLPSGPVDITLLNPSEAGAGGAGVSTTADLARFHSALFTGKLLRPAELAEMKRTVSTGPDAAPGTPRVGYGLGIQRIDWLDGLGCGEVWGHTGGIYGAATLLFGDADGDRQAAMSSSPLEDRDANTVITEMTKAGACRATGPAA
ncbi:serine hydrolase domain-containing protein [Streptomyces sp. NPDC057638]|uniref:serine hydrolase domain-containing protein n=1 Tax=Streptomyces sp. NPDC057638 TaxID=3346190 RepID=UPI0036BFEAC7